LAKKDLSSTLTLIHFRKNELRPYEGRTYKCFCSSFAGFCGPAMARAISLLLRRHEFEPGQAIFPNLKLKHHQYIK
jgi:hypothetical protein